ASPGTARGIRLLRPSERLQPHPDGHALEGGAPGRAALIDFHRLSATAFRLHVTPAEGSPFDFAFKGDSVVVGRAADAGLGIADPFLSGRHSRFFRVGSALFVEDLGSRNGTLVNGAEIAAPTAVQPGDVVQISQSSIQVHAEQTVAPADPAPEESDP